MKIIFISGPSGSGKTTLSNQIKVKINNGIILSTDNYYKTGLISNLLSKAVDAYFDKKLSFNSNLLKKDFIEAIFLLIDLFDRFLVDSSIIPSSYCFVINRR